MAGPKENIKASRCYLRAQSLDPAHGWKEQRWQAGFGTACGVSTRSPRSWRYFVGEAIHHLLGGKSGDGKATDRLQAVVAAMIDEILRGEDSSAQAAGKFLKTRGQVHRRADASEIQPVAAADIAEQHVADM